MGRTTLNYDTANAIQLTTPVLLAHYALLHCAIVKVWRQLISIGVCSIVLGGEGSRHETWQCAAKQKVEHKVLQSRQSRKVAGQSSMRRRSLLTAGASNYCSVRSAVLQFTHLHQLIRLREKPPVPLQLSIHTSHYKTQVDQICQQIHFRSYFEIKPTKLNKSNLVFDRHRGFVVRLSLFPSSDPYLRLPLSAITGLIQP